MAATGLRCIVITSPVTAMLKLPRLADLLRLAPDTATVTREVAAADGAVQQNCVEAKKL